jgi:TRAP-type C4-dicarboxylate transport system substrate-binding protein
MKKFGAARMLGALAITIGTALASPAMAEIRVSSFEPQQGFYSARVLAPWIEEMNPQLSAGAQMRLYPGAILGAATAQYDLVRNGAADIALVVPGYTPGVFPKTSIGEIPFIADNAVELTNMLMTMYEEGLISSEYEDFKLVGLFTTPAYNYITPKEGVLSPEQVKGMRIRAPSAYVGRLIGELGASSINLPATEVYEGLERGIVDATLWNLNAMTTFRLHEPARYFTNLNMTMTPMLVLMNKNTYERLSAEDKAVLDQSLGRDFSAWAAQVTDDYEDERREAYLAEGSVTMQTPSEEQLAGWHQSMEKAPQIWLEFTSGLDPVEGQALLDRLAKF